MNGIGVDLEVLPAFALAMVLVELTPGPNLSYLALLGISNGRRTGLLAVAGITVGLLFWLFVALVGLTRTPLHSPEALEGLRWAGAAYLLWLSWDALRSGSGASADQKPTRAGPFVRGLAANMLNPKAAIFYLALLPGFIKPEAGPLIIQILVLGGLHIAISIVIHSAAVLGAAGAASSLPPRWAYGLRVFLAISLVAAAFWMAVIPLASG